MLAKFRNYVITGMVVVLPLFLSVVILWWVFTKITNGVFHILPYELKTSSSMIFIVRLLIPVVLIALFALIGIVARLVFIRKLFGMGEKLLIKIPLFNKVYITVKQISQAFLSTGKTIFKRVVLVEYPRKGLYSVGFITSRSKGEIQAKTKHEKFNVFIPTTPNPTSGVLIFVSERDVVELDMSVEDGMKLVISGGAVTPEYKAENR